MNELRKFKCLIIEDEPIAAEIIVSFLQKNPEFEIVEICNNAINANSIMKRESVDLIFLDIHLPVIRGFDFLKKLENPPAVIVTTAYDEYATEGYDLDVIDYLLKPIPYERFLKAIKKFKHLVLAEKALLDYTDRETLVVKFAKKKITIILNDILFIESYREYIKINTINEVLVVKMPISKMESLLDLSKFKRVHKSFIVAIDKISVQTGTEIVIGSNKIPLGRKFKNL